MDRRRFVGTLGGAAFTALPLVGRGQSSAPLKLALISAASYGLAGAPRAPGIKSRHSFRHDLQRLG
jgi:hypothetical protein